MIYKNVAGQKVAVYARDLATGEPKTGDAANITAQISKDGGASAATNDANPTELDATDHPGVYVFDLTQAESNADMIVITPASATANIVFEPRSLIVFTQTIMRGTDSAALAATALTNATWTDARAGYLNELGSANIPADVDAIKAKTDNLPADPADDSDIDTQLAVIAAYVDEIESRLTAARAGYLDNLSAGAVALASVCTEARLAELAAANIPADIDTLLSRITAAVALASVCTEARLSELDASGEPAQGAPPASATPLTKLAYLYKAWRNLVKQDATTYELYNDAGDTVDHKATMSDDGTDFTKGEIGSGP